MQSTLCVRSIVCVEGHVEIQWAVTFLGCVSFIMELSDETDKPGWGKRHFFVHRFRCCVDGECKYKENGARFIALHSSRCW
jgi:hypothetical protein